MYVVHPAHSLSSTVSYTFHETYHHTAFNVVMWLPHYMSKVLQLLNVIQQLVFRSGNPVNLRCRPSQLRPRYSDYVQSCKSVLHLLKWHKKNN